MSLSSKDRRDGVIRFLTTNQAINAVNFQLKSYRIWPGIYRKDVADALCRGDIKIGTMRQRGHIAASYQASLDFLSLLDTINLASLHDQGVILHECTHAALDMQALGYHSLAENEAVAYLAQAIFLVRSSGELLCEIDSHVPPKQNAANGADIYRVAARIARDLLGTRSYRVPDEDADSLINIIATHPNYANKPKMRSDRFNRSALETVARWIP